MRAPRALLYTTAVWAFGLGDCATERVLSQRWTGTVELQDGQMAEMEVVFPPGLEAHAGGEAIEFIELSAAETENPKVDPESLPPASLQCYCDFKKKPVDLFAEKPPESQFNNEGFENSFPKNKPKGSFLEFGASLRAPTATIIEPRAPHDRKRTGSSRSKQEVLN
eukprot:INCI14647.1.p1 GENE.INCI14647.1~~INCI14647.1.p1  ORF type:complete len:166 (+),score=26.99 INCI14647.1:146-643(+)